MRSVTLALVSGIVLTPINMTSLPAYAAKTSAKKQFKIDRTSLPIKEPSYPHSTILDARNATPPAAFAVKAPKGAPNGLFL
jgi:arylsulfatase